MIDKIILKIADIRNERLRKKGIINSDNYSLKDYVFRDKLYDFFVLAVFTLIGFLTDSLIETLLVSMTFSLLRSFCGGYHSLEGDYHYEWCIILSILFLMPSALIARYIPIIPFFLWVIVLPCVVWIHDKAPVINDGEELEKSAEEYKAEYMFWASVTLLLAILSPTNIQNSILLANICITPFMSKGFGNKLNKLRMKIFRE